MLAEPVDLIILSGFLGSGKTTLLLDFLRSDQAGDTGVIVNEVGEIGIDGAIVADGSDDRVPMTMLANGCVCCSLRSGLVHTVGSLLDAPRPPGAQALRRIVLETSGVSRPGPIIASLADPELAQRHLRLSVVSTYDCETGALRVEEFEEAAAQLAAAHRIVFTKLDKVEADALAGHVQSAGRVNPLAQRLYDSDRDALAAAAFAPAEQLRDNTAMVLAALREAGAATPHPRLRVFAGHARPEARWDDMARWFDDVAAGCGERLLRLKAVVPVVECPEPILVQSVGTTFSAPRRLSSVRPQDSGVVVIVRDMSLEDLRAVSPDAPVIFNSPG